mmetsp:Transcript_48435/g.134729  ORF Transcript_48435/g.134729 Transcript_48435/m.134729 type:complete len:285 (-) Transcript_48435:175-1029(-)
MEKTADTLTTDLAAVWTDDFFPADKYAIAFWFEWFMIAYGTIVCLAPAKFRVFLGFKTGWTETNPKVSMAVFDWFHQRSFLAMVTHGLCWILFDSVGLKPTEVYALAGLPWIVISLHSLLNEIPKEMNTSIRPDAQILTMMLVLNFLLFIGSPHLLLIEKIVSTLTMIAGLQLYFAPALSASVYKFPQHHAEQPIVVQHMKYYGIQLIVMTILGGTLVWQVGEEDTDKEASRAVVLNSLAVSWLVDVILYIPMLSSAKTTFTNMNHIYAWIVVTVAVASLLLTW